MLYNFHLFASFFSSFPLLDIMTRSYKKADTRFLYIPCILFYTTIKSNNSITLNNILFTPASSIHIVIYFLLIKMIYCSGCIIKCRNHICLDICYFSFKNLDVTSSYGYSSPATLIVGRLTHTTSHIT